MILLIRPQRALKISTGIATDFLTPVMRSRLLTLTAGMIVIPVDVSRIYLLSMDRKSTSASIISGPGIKSGRVFSMEVMLSPHTTPVVW
ncbi:hypothetical protein ES703_73196 [subsurface metagenome]